MLAYSIKLKAESLKLKANLKSRHRLFLAKPSASSKRSRGQVYFLELGVVLRRCVPESLRLKILGDLHPVPVQLLPQSPTKNKDFCDWPFFSGDLCKMSGIAFTMFW
jgi:hypothetical protein